MVGWWLHGFGGFYTPSVGCEVQHDSSEQLLRRAGSPQRRPTGDRAWRLEQTRLGLAETPAPLYAALRPLLASLPVPSGDLLAVDPMHRVF